MSQQTRWSLAACAVALALAGCNGDEGSASRASAERRAERAVAAGASARSVSTPFPVRLEDDAGREIVLEAAPRRIISLVPSATDILIALGQADHLVARTDYDTERSVADLPSVGGGLSPSIERIVSLRPELVVHFRAESDPDTPRQLDAAGIPHVAIRPDRIEDVRRIVLLLGALVGEAATADSLEAAMDADLRAVEAKVAGTARPHVVLLGGNPPSVAGPATFLHELLNLAGGDNVFSDIDELYAPISLEEILVRKVDLILAPEGTQIPAALAAIPVRRFPIEVLNPGLQVARSAWVLARLLHPDRFP